MIKIKNILFVWGIMMLSMLPGHSAPSIKHFGIQKVQHGDVVSASIKNNNGKVARIGSLRSNNSVSTKPATITANSGNTSNRNAARLSVGKYLHNSGVDTGIIKKISSPNTNISSTEFTALGDQVSLLDVRITALEDILAAMKLNVIEADENADEDKMISNLDIDEDGKTLKVTRANIKIPVGSEDGHPAATIWIED